MKVYIVYKQEGEMGCKNVDKVFSDINSVATHINKKHNESDMDERYPTWYTLEVRDVE